MSFPCSFHLGCMLPLSTQGSIPKLHGTSMEPPSKLHQSEHSTQLPHRNTEIFETFMEGARKLHGTSMEPPWNLHQTSISQTRQDNHQIQGTASNPT